MEEAEEAMHCRCVKCGFEWDSIVVTPSSCPECHTREWNEPPVLGGSGERAVRALAHNEPDEVVDARLTKLAKHGRFTLTPDEVERLGYPYEADEMRRAVARVRRANAPTTQGGTHHER